MLKKKNFAFSRLYTSLLPGDTILSVVPGHQNRFPLDGKFRAVIWDKMYADPSMDRERSEIVEAEHLSGNQFIVERGKEGTVPQSWNVDDNFVHTITAGTFDEIANTFSFVFHQPVPSAIWIVTHTLGYNPSVNIVDSANEKVYGTVTYIDNNTLQITFAVPFSGKAFLS